MTIDELLERLEDAKADLGGDTEIRVAIQENWPLKCTINAVTIGDTERARDDEDDDPETDTEFLWIGVTQVGSDENPYAPRWAWDGTIH